MKFSRNHFAALAAALVLVSAGCARQSDQTAEDTSPGQAPRAGERMAYQGQMNGSDMTLVLDPATNTFILLQSLEGTSGGTAQGQAAQGQRVTGNWTSSRGAGDDANATIYVLTPSAGGTEMRFQVVNDNEIRQVGNEGQPMADGSTMRRTEVPDASMLARHITIQDAGSTVQLSPGEEIVLLLPVENPGEQWVLADSAGVPLQRVEMEGHMGAGGSMSGGTGTGSGSGDMAGGTGTGTGQTGMQNGKSTAMAFRATDRGNGQLRLRRQATGTGTGSGAGTATPREFSITVVVE